MIDIWKVGMVEYPQFNKPINYTVDFLKEIASMTNQTNITQEHTDEVIGVLENFIYENGCLKAQEPNIEYSGLGFSPVFNFDLIEYDDYLLPVNGKLDEIGLVEKPRSHIVYNSIERGETMADDHEKALVTAINEKNQLQKENGVLENQIKQLETMLERQKNEIKEIKEGYSDYDKQKERVSELEKAQEELNQIKDAQRQELIDNLVKGNPELSEDLGSFTLEQLKVLEKAKQKTKKPQGVSAQTADGLDNPLKPKDDVYTDEEFEADFAASGL